MLRKEAVKKQLFPHISEDLSRWLFRKCTPQKQFLLTIFNIKDFQISDNGLKPGSKRFPGRFKNMKD